MRLWYSSALILLLAVSLPVPGLAQRKKSLEDRSVGRIEKFKTMRLIEVLKLNDEDAARFTAKQRIHDDTLRSLLKDRNAKIDALDDQIRGNGNHGDLTKSAGEVLALDQKIFDERQRYYAELQKMFTPEQFGRFIIFERNFNRRVREAFDELRNRPGDRSDE